jgi:hypothetical protein
MWKVIAYGEDTGSLYIYAVEAPEDAEEVDVACFAYARHGQSKVRGDVLEYLDPGYTTEWVDKNYVG